MFLKKFDWISPPITLYFKGEAAHVSMYSGILSIVAYVVTIAAAIYYALGFINRESPKAYFFTRYVEDAGTFPVNATQMFNFIQVSDSQTNQKLPLDFAAFRIIGFDDVQANDYIADESIVNRKDHWVYGNCNNDSDTEGIGYLIDMDYYTESACIRKYYDAKSRQYYEPGDPKFRWPVIIKGCSNPERTYYGLLMQTCDKADDLIKQQGPPCKTSTEISEIINTVSFNFQIIDHFADMLNYDMPFTKYFYEVTSAISAGNLVIQHLNFNPANMLTHNGFFFDNQVKEEAYFFIQNEKQTITDVALQDDPEHFPKKTNGCVIGVYFWMQNTLQYYERNYDRIQDILGDIGGISSIVLTIASVLNVLIHNFIIILDTEDLALSLEQENYNPRELTKRPTIFKKGNNVMFPPRRPYQARKQSYGNDAQQQQSSNYQRLMKDGVDIYPNMNSREEKTEQYKNLYLKRRGIINNNNEINKQDYNQQDYNQRSGKGFRGRIQNSNKGNYLQGINENRDTYSRNLKDETTTEKNAEDRPLEKQNFNWCKYLGYLICCGRNDKKLQYYEDFRAKLISEENIIQIYMDTYKLLKHCNIKKTSLDDNKDI